VARDLKLRACLDAFSSSDKVINFETDEVRNVAEAYGRNVRRVYSLALFPPMAISLAIAIQRVVDKVQHEHPSAASQERAELVKTGVAQQHDYMAAIFEKGGPDADGLMNSQQTIAFNLLSNVGPEFNDGPEAWIASQLIATWTAYEAMAGDLWEAALNLKPKLLAKLKGRKPAKAKDTDDPKRIKLDSIFKYDFDIAHRMGTIFLEENRYAFDTLRGIRDAYKDAFSEDGERVLKLINDKTLDAISLVRNNLVHNGGVIDEKLHSRSDFLPSQINGMTIGQTILLDGEIVSALNGPTIENGADLLLAVDSWLVAH
jgi:hypothetical protein